MDPKFRVSIPVDFRPEAEAKVFLFSADSYDMPVVRVLNQEGYDRRVATVNESGKSPKEKTRILGILASRCREASINDIQIAESDRRFHWPLGPRPTNHPGLENLGV